MCGFIGMVGVGQIAPEIYLALQSIQHRGQDSAGIATMTADGERFFARRGLGPVVQAIDDDALGALDGSIGLGHVRYPTVGRGTLDDTQPFFYRVPGVLMAHNGNVTNYGELRDSLRERSIHLLSQCDVEPALCEFSDALQTQSRNAYSISHALKALQTMTERVDGAFSIVIAMHLDNEPTLMLVRDPHGIRPAIAGQRADGSWIAASESVALDLFRVEETIEPQPGEVLFLRHGQPPIRHMIDGRKTAHCVFEYIYFARPDARMTGRSIYNMRLEMGRALAERIREKRLDVDIVVPVPDTARPAATAMAETLSVPLREGFIKNRYSGRTFIMPDAVTRNAALRLKLNPIPTELRGRSILLVDDSIVRGSTLGRVIELLRWSGARAVHLAIHAPPVRHPCFYGIDMSTEDELFARRFSDDLDELEIEAALALGADSLTYLNLDRLTQVTGTEVCSACFDGDYPRPISQSCRNAIVADRNLRETKPPISPAG
jgi:amidophosphoribosyltransferase